MSEHVTWARVAVPLPIYQTFYYSIPEHLTLPIAPGMLVRVPFRNRQLRAVVVEVISEAIEKYPEGLKAIQEIVEPETALSPSLILLTRWIADYYFAPWGEVIKCALPPGKEKIRKNKASIAEGLLNISTPTVENRLNADQSHAVSELGMALSRDIFQCFLLHGITGSGKTEVYIQLISQALALDKTALVLVPEISLTPQVLERFWRCFGSKIAILHSRLSAGERWHEWRRLKTGEASIAIGVRSAVFAPLENLGVIVVDEEHDSSYKQNETPRYHGRDVAIYRGKMENCLIVLGSATPSLESFYNVRLGKYKYLELPCRIDNKPLPAVEIIDMRFRRVNTEGKQKKTRVIFSSSLLDGIHKRLEQKEQVLIFLNRRGFATFIQCEECGFVHQCPNCSVALTYHKEEANFCCHYCGYLDKTYDQCPSCSGHLINYSGFGTQKLEEELRKHFPEARIERMDKDATKKKNAYFQIFGRLAQGEVDILIGTQMVTKGLDFPLITLVGVVAGDYSMNFPDFRAAEKTFQLLTQVAGRAGRGEKPGEVIIQTMLPSHYGFLSAKNQDYHAFFKQEIDLRQKVFFPPFARIALVRIEGAIFGETFHYAKKIGGILKNLSAGQKDLLVMGPVKAPLAKIKNLYRFHLLLKSSRSAIIQSILRKMWPMTEELNTSKSRIKVTFDIDPISLL